MQVLVVDDHQEVLELVERALSRDQHRVVCAASAEAALSLSAAATPEIAIIDLGLPGASGESLCRVLRERSSAIGILILTAESAVSSRVRCLDAGADDYLTKPFAVAELRARVRALSRRAQRTAPLVLKQSELELDFGKRRAFVGGKEVPITAREWAILELLAADRGRVVPRIALLERIWKRSDESAAQSLEVLIGRIRKKLGEHSLRTLRGEGYALGDG
jgi:two-component system, OmpR family, response regulator